MNAIAKSVRTSLPPSTLPVVTLKNVKYAEFNSEETHCFSATVYVDGVAFCIASNEGHGGCDNYEPVRGHDWAETQKKVEDLNARLKTFPEFDSKFGGTLAWSLDIMVSYALEKYLEERDTKRTLSRGVVFYDPARRSCYTLKNAKAVDPEKVKAYVAKKYPGGVVLNFIDLADAVEYLTGRRQPGVC